MSGGWLFAPTSRGWHKEIEVRVATGPGKGAKHSPSSYEPTADYLDTEERFARNGADHLVRIGDWHSHACSSSDPSDNDLDAWQNCVLRANERRGVSRYVELIAAEDMGSFPRMRLHAFCLSYVSFGRVVCEPASLKEKRWQSPKPWAPR